jgi:hypothetical protein
MGPFTPVVFAVPANTYTLAFANFAERRAALNIMALPAPQV